MIHLEFNTIFLFLFFWGERDTKKKKQCIALPKEKRNINFLHSLNFTRVSLRYVTLIFFLREIKLPTYLTSWICLIIEVIERMDTWHPATTQNVHHKIHLCRRRKGLFTYLFLRVTLYFYTLVLILLGSLFSLEIDGKGLMPKSLTLNVSCQIKWMKIGHHCLDWNIFPTRFRWASLYTLS